MHIGPYKILPAVVHNKKCIIFFPLFLILRHTGSTFFYIKSQLQLEKVT